MRPSNNRSVIWGRRTHSCVLIGLVLAHCVLCSGCRPLRDDADRPQPVTEQGVDLRESEPHRHIRLRSLPPNAVQIRHFGLKYELSGRAVGGGKRLIRRLEKEPDAFFAGGVFLWDDEKRYFPQFDDDLEALCALAVRRNVDLFVHNITSSSAFDEDLRLGWSWHWLVRSTRPSPIREAE